MTLLFRASSNTESMTLRYVLRSICDTRRTELSYVRLCVPCDRSRRAVQRNSQVADSFDDRPTLLTRLCGTDVTLTLRLNGLWVSRRLMCPSYCHLSSRLWDANNHILNSVIPGCDSVSLRVGHINGTGTALACNAAVFVGCCGDMFSWISMLSFTQIIDKLRCCYIRHSHVPDVKALLTDKPIMELPQIFRYKYLK